MHGAGKLPRLKCHIGHVRLETRRVRVSISGTPSPCMPPGNKVSFPRVPQASLTLRWHKGTNKVCPRETHQELRSHTTRHLAQRVCQRRPQIAPMSCQGCFYLRESVVHLGARMAEWGPHFGQPALSPRWEPGSCPQLCVASGNVGPEGSFLALRCPISLCVPGGI